MGDLQRVEEFLRKNPALVHCTIDDEEGAQSESPLHIAAAGNHVQCARLLIAYQADLLARSLSGATAVHTAAVAGATEVLQYLVSLDRHLLNVVDYEEATPLHSAVKKNQRETVRSLLKMGASVTLSMVKTITVKNIRTKK